MSLSVKIEAGRVKVFHDEQEVRSFLKAVFISCLRNKMPETFAEFLQLEAKVAKEQALNMLARRAYFKPELAQKLAAKGLAQTAVEGAIAFCESQGLFDDTCQLKCWIEKEQRKGRSARAILFKLKQKKMPVPLQIERGLLQGEAEQLSRWLQASRKKIERMSPQQCYGHLLRKGFSSEAIRLALNSVTDYKNLFNEPIAKLACPGKTDDFEAETFRYDETYPGRVGEE